MSSRISPPSPDRRFDPRSRSGAISVLSAFCLVISVMMLAFAIDIGYVMIAKADLQRSADAAVQSAVLDYRNDGSLPQRFMQIRQSARSGVEANPVLRDVATVDLNIGNADPNGDVLLGRIDFNNTRQDMTFDSQQKYNAVSVRLRRTTAQNGNVPLFFARVMGISSLELEATATAAIIVNVNGFEIPATGENVPMLPITISEQYWDDYADNFDDYGFDSVNEVVVDESDGTPEIIIYPNETGSSGNLGTLNIGGHDNSTSNLGKQIRNGLSPSNLAYHGGKLELNDSGNLLLTGDPGLSGGIADDLAQIAGSVRIMPIYRTVSGNGNTSTFNIVRFETVRLMAVSLTGDDKFVAVQRAKLTFNGVIQGTSSGTSNGVFSSPVIVH